MAYKNVYIYLDDMRSPDLFTLDNAPNISNKTKVITCRSYRKAIAAVETLCAKDYTNLVIDLDHDLGSKKTGYDFCKWLVENGWVGKFHCHTANPVGAANMKQLLTHYGWKEFYIINRLVD